ncbi:MAG TPA: 4-(cytidine 5'-diphospho)-2-C-methyl-D-erythritol kinase [Bryobacteraceae bacterium]|nr:4-(cytidine 5'-diphospho)-2-C-methyl-D-erythritol kinase [Bryobacteraceae bacterium]
MSRRASRKARRARVPALAKINLDLRVVGKRPDGYHELRTIFQTISLADSLELAFTPQRTASIEIDDALAIPDNLAVRAARLAMDAMRVTGKLEIHLTKRIPMGAGLGGGSSDAAAVLLALPVLAGRKLPLSQLGELAAQLGSDVAFFLQGGTAIGIGRGNELFPLPHAPGWRGILAAPGTHVSTADAYRRLSPHLTTESQQNKIFSFGCQVWAGGVSRSACNDFEAVVFEEHPNLAALKRKLQRSGAALALLSGSGSAVFGLFRTSGEVSRALARLKEENAFRVSLVSRARYRRLWWRALEEHIDHRIWPPQSRYVP